MSMNIRYEEVKSLFDNGYADLVESVEEIQTIITNEDISPQSFLGTQGLQPDRPFDRCLLRPYEVRLWQQYLLTTGLQTSLGHPSVDDFPNVKRVADAVLPRKSVQLVYEKWIADKASR